LPHGEAVRERGAWEGRERTEDGKELELERGIPERSEGHMPVAI
jgi:hypothetical protein